MLEDKNLKDPEGKFLTSYGAGSLNMSVSGFAYSKLNKLVIALYMVTDIMEKDEPLRNKLRTSGVDIVLDSYSMTRSNLVNSIVQILSFLDIASTLGMISEMNCSILKKEFLALKQNIENAKQISLSEFFKNEPESENIFSEKKVENNFKRQSTSIGVQKGSTLLKALKKVKMSDRISSTKKDSFDVLKQERRNEILKIIKTKNNATITDIRVGAKGVLAQCGEKTLQRELVSMVKDGVLNKTGEKRWSKYRLGFSN